jgi:hypothetical protein
VLPGYTFQAGGTVTGPIKLADGTVALPSLVFGSDPTTGWYRATSDVWVWTKSSSPRLRIQTDDLRLASSVTVGWTASDANAAEDTSLSRGGAAGKIVITGTTPALTFGGITSSFPAIVKSGAQTLSVVAADDLSSAYDLLVRNINPTGVGALFWTGRDILTSTADGTLTISNSTAASVLTFQTNGTPTCSTNCGTSPAVVGNNSAGTVTMGATGVPASGWVVTFAGAGFAAAPSCQVTAALAGMVAGKTAIVVATTTTTFTVTTNGTAPATSDKYTYTCTLGA